MTDLHITNGDGAANILKQCGLEGDVLPWRDPMHHGPFPEGHSHSALSKIRAAYLCGPGIDRNETERGFQLRDDHLRAAPQYNRVILWFEHDLLDQLQILQLLDWLSQINLGDTILELICVNQFDGIEQFRGIGQLNAQQMAALYTQRRPITPDQIDLAQTGWAAFCSANPQNLVQFIKSDLTALPFLQNALHRHLEEYPARQNGLTRTERQILQLVAGGICSPEQVFIQNMDFENYLYIGDWKTYGHIALLCAGPRPLLTCQQGETKNTLFRFPPEISPMSETFRNQRLQLTQAGEEVLAGARSAFDLIKRDQWLGGVHLNSNEPMWCWDEAEQNLISKNPAQES